MFQVKLTRHEDGGLIVIDGPPNIMAGTTISYGDRGGRVYVPRSELGDFFRQLVMVGLSFTFDGLIESDAKKTPKRGPSTRLCRLGNHTVPAVEMHDTNTGCRPCVTDQMEDACNPRR